MTFEEYVKRRIVDIRSGKESVDDSTDTITVLEENLKLVSSPTPPLLALDGNLLAFYIPANQAWCIQFNPKQGSKLNPGLHPHLSYQEACTIFNDLAARVREESGI